MEGVHQVKLVHCFVVVLFLLLWTRGDAQFTQQWGKIVGSPAAASQEQGQSVAVSGDGYTMVSGAPGVNSFIGALWIFTRSGNAWLQQGPPLYAPVGAGSIDLGTAVAISYDGNTVVAGGPIYNLQTGGAWVYTRSGGVWSQQGPDTRR